MDFNLSEKEIIYILNCISITLNFIEWHTYEEKERIKMYFNYENYYEYYNDLELLHRVISLSANKEIYGIRNQVYFKGQEEYLLKRNFDFLKKRKTIKNNFG